MKKILFYISMPVLLVGLNACLEDKGYTDIVNSDGNTPVVSLFGPEPGPGLYPLAIDFLTEVQDVPITVTAGRANADITVKLKLVPELVDAYNAQLEADALAAFDTLDDGSANYDPYDILPDSTYTIPSLTIQIPKGTLDVDLIVKVNSSKISLDDNYILPVAIESISGDPTAVVAENLDETMVNIQVKNNYDGIYKVKGLLQGHPSVSGPIDFKGLEYTTVSQYTNVFNQPYGTNGQFAVVPSVTVNPADNSVTVGTGSADSPTIIDYGGGKYIPADRTFYLNLGWTTRVATDTLIYTGPR